MNGLIEKVYNLCPIWTQNIMISLYGLKLYRQRYGGTYKKAFLEYFNNDYSNITKEKVKQNYELRKLISYAVENSPYYRNLYKDIDIEKIHDSSDLVKLPILEKEELRKNLKSIYTIQEAEGISAFTGGTTGKSLKVLYTKDDFQRRIAFLDSWKSKLGVEQLRVKKATFSGREFILNDKNRGRKIFWRNNYFYKQRLYSTFDLTDENIPYYLANLNVYKPHVLNGFVSALYVLAKYVERHNIILDFTPKAIFTTSETLLPIHRELIQTIFKSNIYDQYSSSEGAPFITECVDGNLHYNLNTGVIESIETTFGNEMLLTSFTSYGTPLIRYRIGDKISFKDGVCTCGSTHPLVLEIEGRKVEFLMSKKSGRISLSHLADVIKGLPQSIINMQFYQDNIESITVSIVRDEKFYSIEDEGSIIKEMKFRFGEETTININYVDEIPREKSGKFSLIKNNMK